MSELDNLFDQVPDNQVKKSSLDTAFDLAPDNKPKAAIVPTTPVDSSVIPAEPKKFPDVMPGGQVLGVQKQDAITPPVDLNPASKWKFNLDYPQNKEAPIAGTPLEVASAFSGEMGRSLAPLFHGLDYIQTQLGDQLKKTLFGKTIAATIDVAKDKGIPDASHPFKLLYDAMNYAANGPQMPEGIAGDIAKGTAAAIPQVLAAWAAPELTIAPLLEKWGLNVMAKAGLGTISKFGAVMGGQATIESMDANRNSSPMQKMTVPLIKGAEQYITGVFYDMGGIVSSKIGARIAERIFPEYAKGVVSGVTKAERMDSPFAHPDIKLTGDQSTSKMLVHSLATTAFNSNIIGGYGSLVEFLSTGETSWKTYAVGVGTGLALSGREVGKLIGAKMTNSLVAATPEMIQNTIDSPTSSEESFAYARDKFNSASTSKNPEGAAAEGLLATRVGMLKAAIEEIQFNPTDMLKSVEESTTMPQEMKDHLTESINSIVANGDKAVVEAKPLNDQIAKIDETIDSYKKNSNLAPADQEFKIKSMAAKREGLYNKVIAIHEKYAKIKTPVEEAAAQVKTAEDTKQANILQSKAAVVFPKFNEDLTTVADEVGGRVETRLKSPESIVAKVNRQGNTVGDLSDIMGGAIILPDMKGIKDAQKALKNDGWSISNKRKFDPLTGRVNLTAIKSVDGVNMEVQLHTEDTWKAQKAAEELTTKYRDTGRPVPLVPEDEVQHGAVTIPPKTEQSTKRGSTGNSLDTQTRDILVNGKKDGTVETITDAGITTLRDIHINTQGKGSGKNAVRVLRDQARARGEEFVVEPFDNTENTKRVLASMVKSGEMVKTPEGYHVFSDVPNKEKLVKDARKVAVLRKSVGIEDVEILPEQQKAVDSDLENLSRKEFISKYEGDPMLGNDPISGYRNLMRIKGLVQHLEETGSSKADILDLLEKTPTFAKLNNSKYESSSSILGSIRKQIREGETNLKGEVPSENAGNGAGGSEGVGNLSKEEREKSVVLSPSVVSTPHSNYGEAARAELHSNSKNLWVKPDGPVSNDGRILMSQFTSKLMGSEGEKSNKAERYYSSIYNKVPGYNRTNDFWEIPQWQARVAASFKNVDAYVVRDIPEAVNFIKKSGYKEVAFSVLDVTKDKVKALAKALPDITFNVGGYVDMKGYFKDNPNVKIFDTVESMAKEHGVDYVPGYDYRHFEGTPIIPRLEMSTGCLFNCAFCTVSKDNPFTSVDIKTINEHAESIKKLKSPLVYLNDKTFGQAESYSHLPKIYENLKKDNPDFEGFIIQTTASVLKSKLTPEFINKSGIRFIELGVESYNDNILKAVHKPHNVKLIDEAIDIIRKTDAKLIPNIIVGIEGETRQSYDNTLQFLEDNKDIISHANIYSLALYEGTELGNSIEAKIDSDRNENMVEKSFHADPELHKQALNEFLTEAQKIVDISGPDMQYEGDMAKSRKLYREAYKGLENIDLEGSKALTPAQRKAKELGLPVDQQKELSKAWTETKNKLVGDIKGKNIETKAAFADFIKSMPSLSDLSIKLQKRMLAKVNSIDFTKPTSLQKAVDYFENIVTKATFRYDELKAEQSIDILTKKGNQESISKKVPNQPSKNIKGPNGLPLWDELGTIDDNMHNKSWEEGQQKIKEIEARYTAEDRSPTLEEMNQITNYNFWGALNFPNEGSSHYLQGAARDLMSIRKQGYSDAAARKMITVAQNAETMRGRLDALNGKSLTPEELAKLLDTRYTDNKQKTLFDKLNNATNWPITSSFGSRIEFLAQHDKTAAPYKGILYESLVKPLEAADLGNFIDTRDWRNGVNEKAAEIFGTKSKRQLWRNAADRTKTLYPVKFKTIAGKDDEISFTMNQAIKVYMELQDPTLAKSHEAGYYKRNGELTSLGQGVLDILTPEAKAWGDWQINEFYPKMYERLNPVYRMLYGRDMPYNSLYSPIFIQGTEGRGIVSEDLLGSQGFVSGLKNGSLLDRVKHAKVLNLADADRVLESYLHNMAYWKNYSESIQNLNAFVKDPAIRNTIKQNFPNGEDHLKYLEQKVQIYLRKPSDAWMIAGTFSKIRNNVLVSSLALKTLVGVNQVSSAPAFAEYIPMKEIPKYSIESLYNWLGDKGNLAIAKKFWNDPYMQQRYQEGWDNVLTGIVGADIHSVGNKTDWKSNLMFPTKYGDFASVLLGGIPVYRYHYDQAMKMFGPGNENIAHIRAMQVIREATGSTQQSGLEVDLAPIQEANAVFKAITMFKSAPYQYQRKVAAAVRNLISGRGTIGQNIKTIAIYHVLLPSLFQFMSNGFKWDTKEEVRSAVLGPYNDLLAYGDIAEGLWNIYNGESWKKYRASPVLSIYDDAEALVKHTMKVRPSMGRMTKGLPDEYIPQIMKAAEDHRWNMLETGKALKYLGKILGEVSGLPVPGVTSIGQGVYDVATGKTEGKSVGYKMQRILGRSDYTLQDAVDDSDMTPSTFEQLKKKEAETGKPIKQPVKPKNIPNF